MVWVFCFISAFSCAIPDVLEERKKTSMLTEMTYLCISWYLASKYLREYSDNICFEQRTRGLTGGHAESPAGVAGSGRAHSKSGKCSPQAGSYDQLQAEHCQEDWCCSGSNDDFQVGSKRQMFHNYSSFLSVFLSVSLIYCGWITGVSKWWLIPSNYQG